MKLPTVEAREIMGDNFPWIDNYYQMSIPENVIGNVDKTICLITESLNQPAMRGNRATKFWEKGVEVQIFYKEGAGINSLDEELKIARLFEVRMWDVDQSRTHIKDPDTGQVTKVFYFSKIELIKE